MSDPSACGLTAGIVDCYADSAVVYVRRGESSPLLTAHNGKWETRCSQINCNFSCFIVLATAGRIRT